MHFIRMWITIYICNTTAGPFLTHKQKIIGENVNVAGIYLRYLQTTNIFLITEILKDIVREVRELFNHTVGLSDKLSLINRVMIVV